MSGLSTWTLTHIKGDPGHGNECGELWCGHSSPAGEPRAKSGHVLANRPLRGVAQRQQRQYRERG
jgi:hypothetical protein